MTVSQEYEEYLKRGGPYKDAVERLQAELRRATENELHPLHEGALALQKGHHKKAGRLITSVVVAATHDKSSPLNEMAFWLVQMPNAMRGLEHAIKILPPEGYPETAGALAQRGYDNLWGAKEALANRAANSGGQKGKIERGIVRDEWADYKSKEKGAEVFATQLLKDWDKKYPDIEAPAHDTITENVRKLPDYKERPRSKK